MYNTFMKKAWHIDGYVLTNGEVLCRECVAETLDDESFNDPYLVDEVSGLSPIFASDKEEDMSCDYCWKDLD